MDIAVPSRFACLKIEDDDFRPSGGGKPKKKPDDNNKQKQVKGNDGAKKKQQANAAASKKPKKKQQTTAKQWEEWKEKDKELVNGNFEQDLQDAILLSKLDYEEKREMYKQSEKESKKDGQQGKKKKSKAMSLPQFLETNKGDPNDRTEHEKEQLKNDNFFEKVQEEAKDELTKEEMLQKRKKRDANIEQVITISQYQAKLDKEIAKNAALQKELEKARKEIAEVKARNKTLCNILGDGEMKDKADVLLELQRLTGVKNELTEEVSRLHGLLEQERSKVAALTTESQHKHKDKKQKKVGSNNK